MNPVWRVEMLGHLCAVRGEQVVTRFPTRKVGALLAYLAFHRRQEHLREVLSETLWPESEPEAGRNRLRVALAALRQILEPPGIPAGSVLAAGRLAIRLEPEAVTTDVAEFEAALAAAARTPLAAERARHLAAAQERYGGPLLPGLYEDWVTTEQKRLAERLLDATRQLSQLLRQSGDPTAALDAARKAVALDPLCEVAHLELMQLYAESGEPTAALRQFGELERVLYREMGVGPSSGARSLAAALVQSVSAPADTTSASIVLNRAASTPAMPPVPTS